MPRMTAESGGDVSGIGDCANCQSAGSVRAGRCQICEWEAPGPAPVRVTPAQQPQRHRDGGTLTATGG